jgi:hypothetical protein
MRRYIPLNFMAFMAACMAAKADVPVFGNSTNSTSSGFGIVCLGQEGISGAAVEFTPLENMTVSSVTLWLAGYSGQFGQSIDASIWSDDNEPYAPLINFSSPGPNDGSSAAFVFSNASPANPTVTSTVLTANVLYWLVVSSTAPSGRNESTTVWLQGGNPTGNAVYNGSDVYNIYDGTFSASSTTPTFTINAVPEPGFGTLMSLPLLFVIARNLYKKRKSSP